MVSLIQKTRRSPVYGGSGRLGAPPGRRCRTIRGNIEEATTVVVGTVFDVRALRIERDETVVDDRLHPLPHARAHAAAAGAVDERRLPILERLRRALASDSALGAAV